MSILYQDRFWLIDYRIPACDARGAGRYDPQGNGKTKFDFLASSASLEWRQSEFGIQWERWERESNWLPIETFIFLTEGEQPSKLEQKLSDFMARYMGEEVRAHNVYHLQPLNRIHLYFKVDYGMTMYHDVSYIYLLSTLALFIFFIACINFMNLATARSSHRAMEVGMRKVMGADRRILMAQFLGESFLLSLLALWLALSFVELCLPALNAFTLKALSFDMQNGSLWVGLVGIAALVGVVSGSYPAFVLSAFQPIDILKGGTLVAGKNNARFRSFLDEYIDKWNYEAEIKLKKMLRLLSLITIFVACLGLFGLTSFVNH